MILRRIRRALFRDLAALLSTLNDSGYGNPFNAWTAAEAEAFIRSL